MAQRHLHSTHRSNPAAPPTATRGFAIVEPLVVGVVVAAITVAACASISHESTSVGPAL